MQEKEVPNAMVQNFFYHLMSANQSCAPMLRMQSGQMFFPSKLTTSFVFPQKLMPTRIHCITSD